MNIINTNQFKAWVINQHSATPPLQEAPLKPLIATLLNESRPPFSSVIQTYKNDRRSRVTLHEHETGQWVVKRYKLSSLKGGLYRLINATPNWRELRGAQKLKRASIRICMPLAIVHDKQSDGESDVVILPHIAGPTVQQVIMDTRDVDQLTPTQKQMRLHLADQLGLLMGQLTKAKIINRDFKPANLILDTEYQTGATPILIDPCGLRQYRNGQQVEQMIATLAATVIRIGHMTSREAVTFLHRLTQTNPSIAPTKKQVRQLARRVWTLAQTKRDEALAREKAAM